MKPHPTRDEQTRLWPLHGATSELELRFLSEQLRTGHRRISWTVGSWDHLAGPVLLATGHVPPFSGAVALARASSALVQTWSEQTYLLDSAGEGRALMDAREVMARWHDDLEGR